MKIVIAGASGLLGHALAHRLAARGDAVRRLVRTAARGDMEIAWDPAHRRLDGHALDDVDAVINFAGEPIAAGRWTRERKARLLTSRVDSTRTLVEALSAARTSRCALLNASAVGVYGDRGDEELTERSDAGSGFLADICRAWEAEADRAEELGVRTVKLRLGTVLAGEGGALRKLAPLFRAGFGGRLGGGRQWMSWVHIDDVLGIMEQALSDPRCRGAVNVTAPRPVRNAEFTAELARRLRRPAFLPAPAFALRWAFGEMADEALLASTRAIPARAGSLGYAFRYPTLDRALESLLGSP